MQTVFLLPLRIGNFGSIHLHLEQGSHEPSPAEIMAPFHPDPSQRIAVLYINQSPCYLLFRVATLLELAKHGRSQVPWDEWKSCAVVPSIQLSPLMRFEAWVCGSRLFTTYQSGPSSHVRMEVYDFSVQGRAKYLSNSVNRGIGGLRYLSSTGTRVRVPWGEPRSCGGRDSVSFHTVSVTLLWYIRDWNLLRHCTSPTR